jgi:hypothetical protein
MFCTHSTEDTAMDALITDLFEQPARELCHRTADGIEVRLVWYPATEGLAVIVEDPRELEMLEVPVGAADPMDVYQHPYYYAGRLGIGATDDVLAA